MPGGILAKGELLGVFDNTSKTFSTACRAWSSTFCMKAKANYSDCWAVLLV